MSRSRSKKARRDSNASINENDYFGTIYDGMCKSMAFQKLSLKARLFYVLCRVEARSTKGRACLYNHAKEYGINYSDNCFVFPASHLKEYGEDRSNANRYFNELVAAGFIKKVENNKARKKVNVYAFISEWKNTS